MLLPTNSSARGNAKKRESVLEVKGGNELKFPYLQSASEHGASGQPGISPKSASASDLTSIEPATMITLQDNVISAALEIPREANELGDFCASTSSKQV
jgi:hypothetical protein